MDKGELKKSIKTTKLFVIDADTKKENVFSHKGGMMPGDNDVRSLIGKLGVPINYETLPQDLRVGLDKLGIRQTGLGSIRATAFAQPISGDDLLIDVSPPGLSSYSVKLNASSPNAVVERFDLVTGRNVSLGKIKLQNKDIFALMTAIDSKKAVKVPSVLDKKTLEAARKNILKDNNCGLSDLVECESIHMREVLQRKELSDDKVKVYPL